MQLDGGIFYYVNGNIANLTIKDSYIYGSEGRTGGILGYAYANSQLQFCVNSGAISTGDKFGSILGQLGGDVSILNCYYTYQDSLQSIGNVVDGYTADLQSAIDSCTQTDTVLTTYYEFIEWVKNL